MRAVLQPGRLGGLDLDLPQPGLLERPQVLGPDRVARVLGRELPHHADPRPQGGALGRQPPVVAQEILERMLLAIGFVEHVSRLDGQPGRGGQIVDPASSSHSLRSANSSAVIASNSRGSDSASWIASERSPCCTSRWHRPAAD